MNKPQVIDHSDDTDQRISALESDMDTIKTNYEVLVGTLHKSFARVAEDMQEIRDIITEFITHTNNKFQSMDGRIQSMDGRIQSMDGRIQSMDGRIQSARDDLQKSFRDDLRDFRREIKEDVRDSFNGFRWTVGVIVALAVAILKLLP